MQKPFTSAERRALLITLIALVGFDTASGQTASTSSALITATTVEQAADTQTPSAPDADGSASPAQVMVQARSFKVTLVDRPFLAATATNAFDAQDSSNARSAVGGQSSGQPGDSSVNTQDAPPNGGAPPIEVPTARQKLRYGLRQAFYTPGAYIGPAFGAGIRRLQSRYSKVPAKTGRDVFGDYLSDYAREFGTASTTELFGSGIYPTLFKQNTKYTRLKEITNGSASRTARLFYALGNAVVTTGDNGNRQVNISRLGGNLTGAALANIWERDTPNKRDPLGRVTDINRRRGVGATFRQFGFAVGFDAVGNVLEEFLGFGR